MKLTLQFSIPVTRTTAVLLTLVLLLVVNSDDLMALALMCIWCLTGCLAVLARIWFLLRWTAMCVALSVLKWTVLRVFELLSCSSLRCRLVCSCAKVGLRGDLETTWRTSVVGRLRLVKTWLSARFEVIASIDYLSVVLGAMLIIVGVLGSVR